MRVCVCVFGGYLCLVTIVSPCGPRGRTAVLRGVATPDATTAAAVVVSSHSAAVAHGSPWNSAPVGSHGTTGATSRPESSGRGGICCAWVCINCRGGLREKLGHRGLDTLQRRERERDKEGVIYKMEKNENRVSVCNF